MSGTLNIVVITGVIALVFIRQFAAQRLSSEGKAWWLIPVVLTVMAVRQPGLVDPAHHVASAVLLGLEILIGLVCGAGWAWTTRIWTDEDGAVWTKGSWAAAGVWLCGMACGSDSWASPRPSASTRAAQPRCCPLPQCCLPGPASPPGGPRPCSGRTVSLSRAEPLRAPWKGP
ncbi:hypothetical protein ACIGW8_26325 [Streptomyces sioyaensis]|uniref:hypothetical protein n=1 Tax=Streptomyces sioyaensis TaxID=67364 RepID=UPI0037CD14BD